MALPRSPAGRVPPWAMRFASLRTISTMLSAFSVLSWMKWSKTSVSRVLKPIPTIVMPFFFASLSRFWSFWEAIGLPLGPLVRFPLVSWPSVMTNSTLFFFLTLRYLAMIPSRVASILMPPLFLLISLTTLANLSFIWFCGMLWPNLTVLPSVISYSVPTIFKEYSAFFRPISWNELMRMAKSFMIAGI